MNSPFQEMIALIQMLLVMDQAAKLWSAGLLIHHTVRVFKESLLACQLNLGEKNAFGSKHYCITN